MKGEMKWREAKSKGVGKIKRGMRKAERRERKARRKRRCHEEGEKPGRRVGGKMRGGQW